MKREIVFDGVVVNDESPCFVIAEIGNNHQGELENAFEMMRVAKSQGVNAVKFQKRDNKSLMTKELYNSPYDNRNSFGDTYGAHRDYLELGVDEFKACKEYAKEIGITMLSTAFDFKSVDDLEEVDIPLYKVASGDLTNIPLLKRIAETGKPMIISTGGHNLDDVKRAYDAIMPINKQLCILQCTAAYPVLDYSEFNLKVIETYRNEFPENVIGLSDHENGTSMSLAAYMLGARVVEKHFTLNRAWKGTDHSFSLTSQGLKQVVRNLKRLHEALGDGVKTVHDSEKKPIMKMSKMLVAAKDLPVGHVLTEADFAFKCPGDGLRPYMLEELMGKTLSQGIKEDEAFTLEMVK